MIFVVLAAALFLGWMWMRSDVLRRGGWRVGAGLAAAVLGKDRGLTVLSTTRRPERAAELAAIGVDHAIVDEVLRELKSQFRMTLISSTLPTDSEEQLRAAMQAATPV